MTMKLSLMTLAVISAASIAHADGAEDWSQGFGHMSWSRAHGMFGGFMMLVFWGAIIFILVMLVRRFAGGRTGGDVSEDPMDILKSRFAKGELDQSEFLKRKATLED